ncbi:nucleoside-diphosphate sugar epimerase/dehydratase [Ligilactobacillus ruminis]|uniref:Nucleoside-diphosphate sugar epimerase/dehydratase n=1 Tax=Ligilactobacillus ruminis TaxID=1623 RepID=A0AAQ3ATV1_9LACO|nr:nucleoside-diphosphate sugar epimerase/dehydratase [Ligilactobacillus ruminis]WDC82810.1 nucleoside-diphosphate sugar epimerase/dehydratase [Ligilactobacillus ruminis]
MHISSIPPEYMHAFIKFAPIYTIFSLFVFHILRLYNSLWQFASFDELNRIIISSIFTTLFQVAFMTILMMRMPISYYVFGAFLQFAMIVGIRFSYRYINLERNRRYNNQAAIHNVMIIGAGAAGKTILREMRNSQGMSGKACCVIDDNPNKWDRTMEGVPVVGGRDSIMNAVKTYNIDRIMFAIPSASTEDKRDILNICKETKCELKSLPGIYQLANGEVSLSKMKDVNVEDLLERDPIKVDMCEVFKQLTDKTILVTGGGGSIGSELCRQIAAHNPKQLIIFDIYENNAYAIQQELVRKYGNKLNLVTLIGSVRDSRRLDMIFDKYRPDIVYHAAAHKHVPLMETSPNEAIKNNVVGTYKVAYMALKYDVERFVLISTDKAVNPTNIMGASKRLCEMVIQSMERISENNDFDSLPLLHDHRKDGLKDVHPKTSRTKFVAVRFGNVLGSNGSVIPLFKKQIAEGGPVTVTHPDIIRYFMTISEAVSLVLQAGTYAKGGEIFVLDMGSPVKIDTLARNLIKLSGYEPDVDIPIVYTGLRSGEKLYEEKLMKEEGLKKTANELIFIGQPIPFDMDNFFRNLEDLSQASYQNSDDIVERVEKVVSTFHPVGAHPTGKEKIYQN